MFDECLFARSAAIPWVVPGGAGQCGRVAGRRAAQHLWPERRIDGAAVPGNALQHSFEIVARPHGFHPGGAHGLLAGVEARPKHVGFAALVAWIQEQRGLSGLAVDDQNGTRFHHARDVEELVRLAQRLLAGTLGGALNDGDAIADLEHHAGAPGGIFGRRKDIGENGLRGRGKNHTGHDARTTHDAANQMAGRWRGFAY